MSVDNEKNFKVEGTNSPEYTPMYGSDPWGDSGFAPAGEFKPPVANVSPDGFMSRGAYGGALDELMKQKQARAERDSAPCPVEDGEEDNLYEEENAGSDQDGLDDYNPYGKSSSSNPSSDVPSNDVVDNPVADEGPMYGVSGNHESRVETDPCVDTLSSKEDDGVVSSGELYGGYGAAYRRAAEAGNWGSDTPVDDKDVEAEKKAQEFADKKWAQDEYLDRRREEDFRDDLNRNAKKNQNLTLDDTYDERDRARKKKKKKNEKSGSYGLLRVLLCFLLASVMVIIGYPRIESAMALLGTASVQEENIGQKQPTLPSVYPDISSGIGVAPVIPDEDPFFHADYHYIDDKKLDKMDKTELACWYLKEFPADARIHNESALAEFNDWLSRKDRNDMTFSSEFKNAVEYVKGHPELLAEQAPQRGVVIANPDENGGSSSYESRSETPTTPETSTETGKGAISTSPGSGLPSDIDSYDAASVANWVLDSFPAEKVFSQSDYASLTSFYEWLNKKPADFQRMVSGYLDALGWSAN